jgi:hypothetical protein
MAAISIVRSEPSTFITTLADGPSRSSIKDTWYGNHEISRTEASFNCCTVVLYATAG